MRPDEIARRLNLARIEAGQLLNSPGLATTVDSPEFISWNIRVRSLLTHSLGQDHHITKRFLHNQWFPPLLPEGHDQEADYADEFKKGILVARAILEAAIAEFDILTAEFSIAERSTVAADLWEKIGRNVQAETWGVVIKQTVILTQERIEEWARFPESEHGPDVVDPMSGQHSDTDALACGYAQEQSWSIIHRITIRVGRIRVEI